MQRLRKLTEFLALRRNMAVLLGMAVLVGMGEKMAERFLPVYLVALGGGAISIGLLNGMDNLLSALYSFPGGFLSDRLGYKKALAVFNLTAMAGYAIVILFPSWQAVIVGSVFFISWTAISLPATMSMVARVLPGNKRAMGVSLHSLVRRVPMALGPLAGGLFITVFGIAKGIRLAFMVAFALGLVSLMLQQLFITGEPVKKEDGKHSLANLFDQIKQASSGFWNLLVSDILIRFCEQIPYAFVVLWCLNNAGVTPVQFGVLTTIEMATAILIYIPVAYLSDRSTKKPFVVATFVFFTLFPLALLYARSFLTLVFVFILRGLKEFGEPTRKALILDLAPLEQKASMFGFYYLCRDLVVSVAAFGGAFLWMRSPATNFLVALGFGALGTLYFILFGRDLGARRAGHGAAA